MSHKRIQGQKTPKGKKHHAKMAAKAARAGGPSAGKAVGKPAGKADGERGPRREAPRVDKRAERLKDGWVVGRHAVEAVLRHQPQRAKKLWVQDGAKKLEGIFDLAGEAGVDVSMLPKAKLDARVPPELVHQGLLLEAKAFPYAELEDVLAEKPTLIVVLDGVEDPRNLGAAARAAYAMGADAIVIPSRRSAKVTASAEKTAAGCLARLPVVVVDNLTRALQGCQKAGLWVTGGDGAGQEHPWQVDFTGPSVVVIGGEDSGLGRLVQETCDHVVAIPMPAEDVSLNAADALVALLYEVQRQRHSS